MSRLSHALLLALVAFGATSVYAQNCGSNPPTTLGCWGNAASGACNNPSTDAANVFWDIPTTQDDSIEGTCDGNGGLATGGSSTCVLGTLTCGSNNAYSCVGAVLPTDEICDGLDNDCDGVVDNIASTACTVSGAKGICAAGMTQCVSGATQCVATNTATSEVCNGLDDNCDGLVDNALTDAPSPAGCWPDSGTTCHGTNGASGLSWDFPPNAACNGLGSLDLSANGACQAGALTCTSTGPSSAAYTCTNAVEPTAETCNGIDDDCDGIIDNHLTDAPSPAGCWPDSGSTCHGTNGAAALTWGFPTNAACNGLGSLTDSAGGSCAASTLTCTNGAYSCAAGSIPPLPEICNGIDDDCNGLIDDGITCTSSSTGGASGSTGVSGGSSVVSGTSTGSNGGSSFVVSGSSTAAGGSVIVVGGSSTGVNSSSTSTTGGSSGSGNTVSSSTGDPFGDIGGDAASVQSGLTWMALLAVTLLAML